MRATPSSSRESNVKFLEHLALSAVYALPMTLVGILLPLFTYVRRHGFSTRQKFLGIAITWAVATLLVVVVGEANLGGLPFLIAVLVTAYLVFFLLPTRSNS
jgi:hypothetical protein